MEVIDSHHHLWDTRLMRYAEFQDIPSLNHPFMLRDLLPALAESGISRTVCVEAASAGADGLREAVWLREQISQTQMIAGAVLWAPVEDRNLREYLSQIASLFGPLLVGIRRSFELTPVDFACDDAVVAGVRVVGEAGYPFDLVLERPALPAVRELIKRAPDVLFILDHMGKPGIRGGELDPWRDDLAQIAQLPNVVCKISGLTTEADHERWTLDDLRPYIDHAVDCFGWDRLLYGSDWPVNTISGGYAAWMTALRDYLRDVPVRDQAKFFASNCRRVYGLAELTTN